MIIACIANEPSAAIMDLITRQAQRGFIAGRRTGGSAIEVEGALVERSMALVSLPAVLLFDCADLTKSRPHPTNERGF